MVRLDGGRKWMIRNPNTVWAFDMTNGFQVLTKLLKRVADKSLATRDVSESQGAPQI